jgi:hypothetical protein
MRGHSKVWYSSIEVDYYNFNKQRKVMHDWVQAARSSTRQPQLLQFAGRFRTQGCGRPTIS